MKHDYSRPQRAPFPPALAEAIARKASIMAQRLENEALRTMVRDVQRALARGMTETEIRRDLQLGQPIGKNDS